MLHTPWQHFFQSQFCDIAKKQSTMMRFQWYTNGDEDPWRSWYESQDKRVRAKHDVAMRFLEGGNWKAPHFRMLTNYDCLGEIKISARVEHRLIGYRGPEGFDFTVLMEPVAKLLGTPVITPLKSMQCI